MEEMEMRAAEEIQISQEMTPPLAPLAHSLHTTFLHSHCSSCFSPLPNPNPNSTLLYCSSLCSSFADHHHHHHSADIRLALRLLHSLPPSPHSPPFHRISNLLTNRHKLLQDPDISARVRDGARAIAAARNEEGGENVAFYEAVLCLVITNGVEVQDMEGRALGIAVYDTCFSWINHSCSPNASYRFLISRPHDTTPFQPSSTMWIIAASSTNGRSGVQGGIELLKGLGGYGPRIIVRSIKRIRKGEEVTVAYTDLLQPKKTRQMELWSRYHFNCGCTRCSASPPSYVDRSLQEISASNMGSSIFSFDQSFNKDEATRKLTDYVDDVINEYLSMDDPESCCKKLERILLCGLLDEHFETKEGKSQFIFRLHPQHHLALNVYTTLASAYKVQASDLMALHSDADEHQLQVLYMLRLSAAYSLLLATAAYHLFCFESSLIASVANFWTNAGESLLTVAISSAWVLLWKQGLPVSTLEKQKCSKCSLLDKSEGKLSLHGQNTDYQNISSKFFECITSLSQEVWSFLTQGCCYLKMFKDPTDFSWLANSSSMRDFYAHLVNNNMDSNSWTEERVSRFDTQGFTNQERINIFQLGVHCLSYGAFLADICYGQHSDWNNHIQRLVYCEGK